MIRFAGVWISRRRATILTLGSDGRLIASQHFTYDSGRSARNTGSYATPQRSPEDRRNRLSHGNPIERYYNQVLSALIHADRIAIFGSDTTKFDLDLQLRKRPALFEKVVGIQVAREMDPEEFANLIRQFYSLRWPGNAKRIPSHPQEDTMAAGA